MFIRDSNAWQGSGGVYSARKVGGSKRRSADQEVGDDLGSPIRRSAHESSDRNEAT